MVKGGVVADAPDPRWKHAHAHARSSGGEKACGKSLNSILGLNDGARLQCFYSFDWCVGMCDFFFSFFSHMNSALRQSSSNGFMMSTEFPEFFTIKLQPAQTLPITNVSPEHKLHGRWAGDHRGKVMLSDVLWGKISAAFHDNIGTSPNNMTHTCTLTNANGDILFLHVFGEATMLRLLMWC